MGFVFLGAEDCRDTQYRLVKTCLVDMAVVNCWQCGWIVDYQQAGHISYYRPYELLERILTSLTLSSFHGVSVRAEV